MIVNSKLSDEALLKAIYRAASEYSNLIGNSYLIIGKNKNSNYFYFQCYFEKKHFMHLLGIDSKTMDATEFYEKCDLYNRGEGEGITIADCTPSRNHNRTTINEKCSCCADILYIQDAMIKERIEIMQMERSILERNIQIAENFIRESK